MRRNASTQAAFTPTVVGKLLDHLFAIFPEGSPGMLLGLSALQGIGKSTLAAQLADAASERGLPAEVLALDDFTWVVAIARHWHIAFNRC